MDWGFVLGALRAIWLAVRNRPQVICDIRGVFQPRWHPDWLYDDSGKVVAEGTQISVGIEFLLANNGPVDTMIKDIYIRVKWKNEQYRLEPLLRKSAIKPEIGPRKVWGPETVEFVGTVWGMEKPPKNLKGELLVEPVAQHSLRRTIKLSF